MKSLNIFLASYYLILPILKIHWHFISIPAGHISVLQSCCSMDSPLHSPPFLSGATNLRVRNWIPPSQLWLQVDQSLHEPQMQSAVWIWKYNINHINSNNKKSHIWLYCKNNVRHLPEGQLSMLQSVSLKFSPVHSSPPSSSCTKIVLVCNCLPAPQVLVQLVEVLHSLHSQSTWYWEKDISNRQRNVN